MSKSKSGGSKAHQGVNTAGKRFGLKVNKAQEVRAGQVLVRQKGTKYYSGKNTKICRDYTIIALKPGRISFTQRTRPNGKRTIISVLDSKEVKTIKKTTKK